jgi:hypothetical protein
MNISSFPSRSSRLRFALASAFARCAFRVCPENFVNRFIEEMEEACEELETGSPEYTSGHWTQDGTQRLPSDWLRW